MDYLHDEELRFLKNLQTLVQEDSDGYGEDNRNVMFEYDSEGEAKHASDEGSGDENLQNFEENLQRGDGGAPGSFVPPAAMADQNAGIWRRTSAKASRRAQRMVGVPGSENAPAQPAVEVSEWGDVDLVI